MAALVAGVVQVGRVRLPIQMVAMVAMVPWVAMRVLQQIQQWQPVMVRPPQQLMVALVGLAIPEATQRVPEHLVTVVMAVMVVTQLPLPRLIIPAQVPLPFPQRQMEETVGLVGLLVVVAVRVETQQQVMPVVVELQH